MSSTQQDQLKDNTSEIETRLIPVDIDLHKKQNLKEHSTIYYDIEGLLLRRGQIFSITITFNQDFHPDKHYFSFILKPQTWLNIPDVKIPLNSSANGWASRIISRGEQKNNCIHFQIYSPPDAIIGKYFFFLETYSIKNGLINKQSLSIFQFEFDIYFLFNPWLKNDACGLLSSNQIAEYVMNEHGQIYLGSSDIPRFIPWYFGQFERSVLLTAFVLLNKVQLSAQQRPDLSSILRILSSKICSDPGTNNGIFPSSADVNPSSSQQNGYTSSPAILNQYLLSNNHSVQGDSGSNWQHAAVFCSLCRSLGIPSRIVTVYNAIYRAQEVENVDVEWNKSDRPTVVVESKLTCPWYLWNECWMRRDDLSGENSGWQVVDSSSIQYDKNPRRTGPCSVAALKSRTLNLPWNTSEFYGILNGNKTYWLVYPNGNRKLINVEENVINTKILTKPLTNIHEYEDITNNYKLIKISSNQTPSSDDVHIDLNIPHSLKVEDNLNLSLIARNLSYENRTLTVALALVRIDPIDQPKSISQNHNRDISQNTKLNIRSRRSQTPIQSFAQTFHLGPNNHKNIKIKVAETHQVWKGRFDSLLKLYIHVIIKETGQVYQKEKYILNEQNPMMNLLLDNDVMLPGKPGKLDIKIANSSSQAFDNGRITIDGFGISKSILVNKQQLSNDPTTIPAEIDPLRIGIGRLYVTFTADNFTPSPQTVLLQTVETLDGNMASNYRAVQGQPSTQKLMYKDKLPITEKIPTISPTMPLSDTHRRLNDTTTQLYPTNESTKKTGDISPSIKLETKSAPTEETHKLPATTTPIKSKNEIIQQPNINQDHQKADISSPSNADTIKQSTTSKEGQNSESKPSQSIASLQSNTGLIQQPPETDDNTKKTEDTPSQIVIPLQSTSDITKPTSTTEDSKKSKDILPSSITPLQSNTDAEQIITNKDSNKSGDISLLQPTTVEPNKNTEQILTTAENNKPTDLSSLSAPALDSTTTKEQIVKPEENKTQEVISPPSPAASQSTIDVTQNITSTDQKTKPEDIPLTAVDSKTTTQPVTASEDKSKPEDISPSTTLPSQDKTDVAEPITTTDEKKKLEDTAAPSPLPSESKTTPDQIIKTDESKKPEDISSSATVSPQTKTDVTEPITTTDEKKKSEDTAAVSPLPSESKTTTDQINKTDEGKKPEEISSSTTVSPETKTDVTEPITTTDEKKKPEDTVAPLPLASESKTTTDQINKTDEGKKPEEISSSTTLPPQTKTDVAEPITTTDEKKKIADIAAPSPLPSESKTTTDEISKTDESKKPEDISSSATLAPQTKLDVAEPIITNDEKKKPEDTAAPSPLPSESKTTTDQINKTDESKKQEDISSSATLASQTKSDVAEPITTTDEKKKPEDTAASSSLPSESKTSTDEISKTDESKKTEDISSSATLAPQTKTDVAEPITTTDEKKKPEDIAAPSPLPSESKTTTDQINKTDESKKQEDISSSATLASQTKSDVAEPITTTDEKKKPEDTAAPSPLPSESKTTTDQISKTEESKKPEDISSSTTLPPQAKLDVAEPFITTDEKKKIEDIAAPSPLPSESKTTTDQIMKTDESKKPEDISSSATLPPQTKADVVEPIMTTDENKKIEDTAAPSPLLSESKTSTGQIIETEENKKPEDTSSSAPLPPSAKIDVTDQTITTVERTKLEDNTAGPQLPVETKVPNEHIVTIEENKKPEDILASPTTESTANAADQISTTDQKKKSEDTSSFPPSLGDSKTMPESNRITEDGKKSEDMVPASLLTSETMPVATEEITTDEKHKPENILTPTVQHIDSNTTTEHSITPEESKKEGDISPDSKTITEEKTDENNQVGDKAPSSTASPQSMNNISVPVITNEESSKSEDESTLPTAPTESKTTTEQIITTEQTIKPENISVTSSLPIETKTTTEHITTLEESKKPEDISTSSTLPLESTTTATQFIPPVESEKPEDMTSAPGLPVDSEATTEQMITTEEKKKLDDVSYPLPAAAQSKINGEEINTTEENKAPENVSPQSVVSPQSKADIEPPMRTEEDQKAEDISSLPTVPLQSNTDTEHIVKIDEDDKSTDVSSSSARPDETNIGVIEPINTSEDDNKLASMSQPVPPPLEPKTGITEETVRIDDVSKPEEKSKVSDISSPTTTTTEQEVSASEHTKKPDDIKPPLVLPLELKNTTEQNSTAISSEKPTELLPIHGAVDETKDETMEERMPVNEISKAEDGSPSALLPIDSNDEAAKKSNKSEENKPLEDSQAATEVTQPSTTAADTNNAEHTTVLPVLPTQPTADTIQETSTREEIERRQSVPLFSIIPTLRRTQSRQESIENQETEAAKGTTPSAVLPSSIETKPILESTIIEGVTKEEAIPKLPAVQSPSATDIEKLDGASDLSSKTETTPDVNTNEELSTTEDLKDVQIISQPSITPVPLESHTTPDTIKTNVFQETEEIPLPSPTTGLSYSTQLTELPTTIEEIKKDESASSELVKSPIANIETTEPPSTTDEMKRSEGISQFIIKPYVSEIDTLRQSVTTEPIQTDKEKSKLPAIPFLTTTEGTDNSITSDRMKMLANMTEFVVKAISPLSDIIALSPGPEDMKKLEGLPQFLLKPFIPETRPVRESITNDETKKEEGMSQVPVATVISKTDITELPATDEEGKQVGKTLALLVTTPSSKIRITEVTPTTEKNNKPEGESPFPIKPVVPETEQMKKDDDKSWLPSIPFLTTTEGADTYLTPEKMKIMENLSQFLIKAVSPLSDLQVLSPGPEERNKLEGPPQYFFKPLTPETVNIPESITTENIKKVEDVAPELLKSQPPNTDITELPSATEDIKKVEDASTELFKSQSSNTDITELPSATEEIIKPEGLSQLIIKPFVPDVDIIRQPGTDEQIQTDEHRSSLPDIHFPMMNNRTENFILAEKMIILDELSEFIIKAVSPLSDVTALCSGPEDTKKFEDISHILLDPVMPGTEVAAESVPTDHSRIEDDISSEPKISSPDTIFETNQIQTTIKDNEKDVNNKEPLEITVETTFERTTVIDTKKEDNIEETMKSLLDTIDQIMLDIAEVENIQKELEVMHSTIPSLETTLPTSNETASSLLEGNQQITEQGVENDEQSKAIVVEPATDEVEVSSSPEKIGSTTLNTVPTSVSTGVVVKPIIVITPAEPVTNSASSVVPKKSDKLKDSTSPSSTISKEKKKDTTTTKVNPSTSKQTTPTKSSSKTSATNAPTKTSKKSVPITKPSKTMKESTDTKQVRSSSASPISSISEFFDANEPSETSDEEYFDALSDFNNLITDGASKSSLLPQDIAVKSPSSHTPNIETTITNDVSDVNKTSEDETYKKIKSRAGVITDRILSYVANDLELLLSDPSTISSISPNASIPVENERVIDTFDENKQSEVILSSAPLSPQSKIDLPEQIITIDDIKTAEDILSSPIEEKNRMEEIKTGEDISNMPNLPLATTNERTEESTKIEDNTEEMTQQLPVTKEIQKQENISETSTIPVPSFNESTQGSPILETTTKLETVSELPVGSLPLTRKTSQETDNSEEKINNIEASPLSQYIPSSIKIETTEDNTTEEEPKKAESVSQLPFIHHRLNSDSSEKPIVQEWIMPVEVGRLSRGESLEHQISFADEPRQFWGTEKGALRTPVLVCTLGRKIENAEENATTDDSPKATEENIPTPENIVLDSSFKIISEPTNKDKTNQEDETIITKVDDEHSISLMEEMKNRRNRFLGQIISPDQTKNNEKAEAFIYDNAVMIEDEQITDEQAAEDGSNTILSPLYEKPMPFYEKNLEDENTNLLDSNTIPTDDDMKSWLNQLLNQFNSSDETKIDENASLPLANKIYTPENMTNTTDDTTRDTSTSEYQVIHETTTPDEIILKDVTPTVPDNLNTDVQVVHETNNTEEKAKIDEKPTSLINDTTENIVSNMKDIDKSEETIEEDKDFKDWLRNLLEQIITDDDTKLNEETSILLNRSTDTKVGTTLPPHLDNVSTRPDATKVDDEIYNSVHSDPDKIIEMTETTTKTEETTKDEDSSPLINVPNSLESQSVEPVTTTSDNIPLISETEILKEVEIPSPVEQSECTELNTLPTTSVLDAVPKPAIDITLSEPAIDSTLSSVSTMRLETPTLDIEHPETTQQNLDIEKIRSSSTSSNLTTGDYTDPNGLQETSDTEYFDASRDLKDLLGNTASKSSLLSQDTTATSPSHMPDIQIKTIEDEDTNLLDSNTTPTDDDMKSWLNQLLNQFNSSDETKIDENASIPLANKIYNPENMTNKMAKIDDTTGDTETSECQVIHETNDTEEKAKVDEKPTTENIVSNMKDIDKSEETIEADKDFKDWLSNLLEQIITDDDTKLNEETSILLNRSTDTKVGTTLPPHLDNVSTTPDATKVDDEIYNSVHSDPDKIIEMTETTTKTEETTKDEDSSPLINVPNSLESQSVETVTTTSDNISLISKTEILKDVEILSPVEQSESTELNTSPKTSVHDVVHKPAIEITSSEPAIDSTSSSVSTMPLETSTLDTEHPETTQQNLDIEKIRSSSTSSNLTIGDYTDPNDLQETSDTEYFDASRDLNDLLGNTASKSSLLSQDTTTTSPSHMPDVNESIVDDEIYKTVDSQAKIMADRILYDVTNDLEFIHNDPSLLTALLNIDSIPTENEWEPYVLGDTTLEREDTKETSTSSISDDELLNSDISLDNIKLYGEFLSDETLASAMYPDMTEPDEELLNNDIFLDNIKLYGEFLSHETLASAMYPDMTEPDEELLNSDISLDSIKLYGEFLSHETLASAMYPDTTEPDEELLNSDISLDSIRLYGEFLSNETLASAMYPDMTEPVESLVSSSLIVNENDKPVLRSDSISDIHQQQDMDSTSSEKPTAINEVTVLSFPIALAQDSTTKEQIITAEEIKETEDESLSAPAHSQLNEEATEKSSKDEENKHPQDIKPLSSTQATAEITQVSTSIADTNKRKHSVVQLILPTLLINDSTQETSINDEIEKVHGIPLISIIPPTPRFDSEQESIDIEQMTTLESTTPALPDGPSSLESKIITESITTEPLIKEEEENISLLSDTTPQSEIQIAEPSPTTKEIKKDGDLFQPPITTLTSQINTAELSSIVEAMKKVEKVSPQLIEPLPPTTETTQPPPSLEDIKKEEDVYATPITALKSQTNTAELSSIVEAMKKVEKVSPQLIEPPASTTETTQPPPSLEESKKEDTISQPSLTTSLPKTETTDIPSTTEVIKQMEDASQVLIEPSIVETDNVGESVRTEQAKKRKDKPALPAIPLPTTAEGPYSPMTSGQMKFLSDVTTFVVKAVSPFSDIVALSPTAEDMKKLESLPRFVFKPFMTETESVRKPITYDNIKKEEDLSQVPVTTTSSTNQITEVPNTTEENKKPESESSLSVKPFVPETEQMKKDEDKSTLPSVPFLTAIEGTNNSLTPEKLEIMSNLSQFLIKAVSPLSDIMDLCTGSENAKDFEGPPEFRFNPFTSATRTVQESNTADEISKAKNISSPPKTSPLDTVLKAIQNATKRDDNNKKDLNLKSIEPAPVISENIYLLPGTEKKMKEDENSSPVDHLESTMPLPIHPLSAEYPTKTQQNLDINKIRSTSASSISSIGDYFDANEPYETSDGEYTDAYHYFSDPLSDTASKSSRLSQDITTTSPSHMPDIQIKTTEDINEPIVDDEIYKTIDSQAKIMADRILNDVTNDLEFIHNDPSILTAMLNIDSIPTENEWEPYVLGDTTLEREDTKETSTSSISDDEFLNNDIVLDRMILYADLLAFEILASVMYPDTTESNEEIVTLNESKMHSTKSEDHIVYVLNGTGKGKILSSSMTTNHNVSINSSNILPIQPVESTNITSNDENNRSRLHNYNKTSTETEAIF